LIVNVLPAMVNVPDRGCATGFDTAVKVTVPFPSPVAPPVMVSHEGALFAEVHMHPAGAVTLVDPLPPAPDTDTLVGETA
jgi:hypothetical protein